MIIKQNAAERTACILSEEKGGEEMSQKKFIQLRNSHVFAALLLLSSSNG